MKTWKLVLKIILTVILCVICPFVSVGLMLLFLMSGFWEGTAYISMVILPAAIPVIWLRKYKACWISYCAFLLSFCVLAGVQGAVKAYDAAITIDVAPSINTYEYLPFQEDSLIVKKDSQLLDFSDVPKDDLPVIDGAAAAFPVYSAFVHAVYPETIELYDGTFEYNNTVGGMGGIIEEVADYKNKSTSIGFSFRYYVEGIIKNPDIKMIAIDGIAPTVENIQNGNYPVIAPVYAVTYEGNSNPHVQELIDWKLTEEGQYIIEQTGYVGIGS